MLHLRIADTGGFQEEGEVAGVFLHRGIDWGNVQVALALHQHVLAVANGKDKQSVALEEAGAGFSRVLLAEYADFLLTWVFKVLTSFVNLPRRKPEWLLIEGMILDSPALEYGFPSWRFVLMAMECLWT